MKIGEKRKNIFLRPTTNIPQLDTPCVFSGKVEGDPLSKVFVSGCYNSSETLVSLVSSQLPGGFLDLSLVNDITTSIADQRERTENLDYSAGQMADDAISPPPVQMRDRTRSFSGALPSKMILKTDIKYDNSLLKHFHNSHQKTKDWINKVVGHTQTRLYHESIRMKISLKVGTVSHIAESIKADKANMYKLYKKKQPQLNSYFCEDIIGGGAWGMAFSRAACNRDGYAVNIVELFSRVNPEIQSAKVFAHELGHNLGMK